MSLTPTQYQEFVSSLRTARDDESARERIMAFRPYRDVLSKPDESNLLPTRLVFALVGLAGETGELADALLKWIYYGQPLDTVNIKEELGDMLWYITKACSHLGITLEDLMESNHAKLRQRYPEQYSNQNAAEENRDRQAERGALNG